MSPPPRSVSSPTSRPILEAQPATRPRGSMHALRRGALRLALVFAATLAGALASPAIAWSTPPTNLAPPTITGTLQLGYKLTVDTGVWSGRSGKPLLYQWQRCDTAGANCVDIANATTATLKLVAADAGQTIRTRVTATNAVNETTSSTSNPTPRIAGIYRDVILGDDPVGYWRLGETASSIAANEVAGVSLEYRNGVQLGSPGAIEGDTNKAATLDGLNDYVAGPIVSANTDNITLELWVYRTGGVGSWSRLVLYNGYSGSDGYGMLISNGSCFPGLTLFILLGGVTCNAGGTLSIEVPSDRWTHLAVTRTNGFWRFYQDGNNIGSSSTNPRPPILGGFSIGATFDGLGNHFEGRVDEVAFYNRALSTDEILERIKSAQPDRIVGRDEQIAHLLRPVLRFHSGEDWRPLEVDNFFGEVFDGGARHKVCRNKSQPGFECGDITGVHSLWNYRNGWALGWNPAYAAGNESATPRDDDLTKDTSWPYLNIHGTGDAIETFRLQFPTVQHALGPG